MTAAAWEMAPTGALGSAARAIAAAIPVLRTNRLVLRAPRITDFNVYAGICCSDRVGGHTRSIAVAERLGAFPDTSAPYPKPGVLTYRHLPEGGLS